MKKHSILAGFGLVMLALSAQAQDIASVRPPKTYGTTSTMRVGIQGISLGSLNQTLQQTGYGMLPNQFAVFGAASEVSRRGSPWSMHSQFDFGLNSASQPLTNGANTVRSSYFQWGIGVGYRALPRSDKFTLTPRLLVSAAVLNLGVNRTNAPTPSVASILTNPTNQQTARLVSGTIAGDLGVSGQYRFVYGSTTTQTDCGALTKERSLILGFDAGYRLSPTTSFNQSTNDVGTNPTVNLSGWYVAARVGLGRRYVR